MTYQFTQGEVKARSRGWLYGFIIGLFVGILISVNTANAATIDISTNAEDSGYLVSNTVTVTISAADDDWFQVVDPSGRTCNMFQGVSNGQIGGGPATFGGPTSDIYPTYIPDHAQTVCTPDEDMDLDQDGDWYFKLYNDSGFTTLNDSEVLTIGGGGGEEATTTVMYSSTSTVDQIHENLFNGFVIFFMSMFGMIWAFRRPRI